MARLDIKSVEVNGEPNHDQSHYLVCEPFRSASNEEVMLSERGQVFQS